MAWQDVRALIIGGGDISDQTNTTELAASGTLIIAADGGGTYCLKKNILPHVVVGDLDSLPPQDLKRLCQAGVTVMPFPARKDATDLELAVRYAAHKGAEYITIVGWRGGRTDHMLGALLLGAQADMTAALTLVDGEEEITILKSGKKHVLMGAPGDIVSLLPLGGDVVINGQSLEYPLDNTLLRLGSSTGISNVITEVPASLEVISGTALCILRHRES